MHCEAVDEADATARSSLSAAMAIINDGEEVPGVERRL